MEENVKIKTYDVSFNVRIARFNALDDFARGELLRRFVNFMQEEGLRHNFLVATTQIVTGEAKETE